MDLKDLIKTYRVINDPRIPKVSMKFLGVFVLAALWGFVIVLLATGNNPATAPPPSNTFHDGDAGHDRASSSEALQGSVYVGYDPATFDPALDYEPARVIEARDAWIADHSELRVLREEVVTKDGFVVGFTISYERIQDSEIGIVV